MDHYLKNEKMKKIFTLKVCLFILISSYSQKKEICGQIEYKFTTNIAYKHIENYTLTFNNKKSFCEEKNVEKESSKKNQEEKDEGLQQNFIVGRKNITRKYYYDTRKDFYVKDNYLDEILIFKEKPLKEVWKLHSETKKLSNFLCKKATISFRGRNYTAWYTAEIPDPFGPWKLRGLPGVILELYDTDRVFHVLASHVKVGIDNCTISVDEKELKKAMSLNSYLDKKEELIDKMFAEMSAKRPKGTKPFKRDKSCEDCSKGIEIFNEKN